MILILEFSSKLCFMLDLRRCIFVILSGAGLCGREDSKCDHGNEVQDNSCQRSLGAQVKCKHAQTALKLP